MVAVRPKYRVGPGFLNENGPERDGPFMNALATLVRHRGADRVPHATDLLAHDGQRADYGDADEDQDEPVLGVGLAT